MPKKNSFIKNSIGESDKFIYQSEYDFVKKLRSLKKYCPRAYKDLIFNINMQDLFNGVDGTYTKELHTDPIFKLVYGQIKLVYRIQDGKVIINDLLPQQFLLDGYFSLLEVYKGIPYRNEMDKFKIDLSLSLKERT